MKIHLPLSIRRCLLACITSTAGVCICGTSAMAESQNLTFSGSDLTWNTLAENAAFVTGDGASAPFTQGDNVSFTNKATVTLEENISAGTIKIESEADVIILQDNYTLEAERIELAGSLDVGNTLHIDNGTTLAVVSAPAVLNSNLVLGNGGTLASGAAANLNGNTLALNGGSELQLTATGDGKTYTLFTGISGLKDAQGNTIALNSTNNAIANYFDINQPGTGFWAGGTLQLTDAGSMQLVLHNEAVKRALTVASRRSTGAVYRYYSSVIIENISSSSNGVSSSSNGGAIYGDPSSTITLNNNGSVVFEGNTVSAFSYAFDSHAYGGAISGYGDITLSNNGSVVFEGNTASSSSSDDYAYAYAYGGAIYGGSSSTITLRNNESVTFSGNTASSTPFYARGGAIYGNTITLSDNGSVTFSENTATGCWARGGAIYGNTITLSDNGSVSFSGNTASTSYYASSSSGGAIYGDYSSTITLSDNGSVVFDGNTASTSYDSPSSSGGAIYGVSYSTITLSNNGSVSFSGNTASARYAYGGAIYGGSSSTITLSDNGSVSFSGNTASASSDSSSSSESFAYGGAIYGDSSSTITLSDNGSVSFSGNTASASSSANGGAIYASGNLSIRNNESVLFEKNVEKSGSSYRLRSIYAGGSGDAISLSAAVGKSIEFRDSVYIASGSTVNLNADYTYLDEAGESVTIRQTGDIIFTGKYTETHLNEILKAGNAGRNASKVEILNSRTSEVYTMTNLYGGRLRVEDGAVYKGNGITAHVDSAATVRVKDAELSHVGYELEFNAGTALEVAGNSTIRGNVKLLEQSTFKLEQAATLSLHETVEADVAALTVNGTALLEGNSTLNASLTLADGATLDMDVLDAGAVTLNGALTFAGKVCMGTQLQDILSEMRGWEESITLFTGLTNLVLPGTVSEDATGRVWVGDVFSNMEGHTQYYFNYSPDVGSLAVVYIPEPATSTLSLLALTALATRRKRK